MHKVIQYTLVLYVCKNVIIYMWLVAGPLPARKRIVTVPLHLIKLFHTKHSISSYSICVAFNSVNELSRLGALRREQPARPSLRSHLKSSGKAQVTVKSFSILSLRAAANDGDEKCRGDLPSLPPAELALA